jgi:hypothetical protein
MAFDSLARLIDEFEQQPNWHRQARFRQVLRHWSGVVGAVVAGQAIPVRLERQVLYVAVANAMWGQTLTLERLTILTRLNPQLGFEVKDIRFSPADWYHRASETPAPSLPQPSPLPDWLRHHPSFDARLWSTVAPPGPITQRRSLPLMPRQVFAAGPALISARPPGGCSVPAVIVPVHRGK